MMHISSLRSLLLNSSYEPMQVVSWQKALVLWLQDKVEILEFHSAFARSVQNKFQLPSVLRLKSYVKLKSSKSVRFCRENVYIRDNYTCQYCAKKFTLKHLTLDHVVPSSQMGPTNWTNVVTACRECNQKKANRTPRTANMPLLNEPAAPAWLPLLKFEIAEESMPLDWAPYLRFYAGLKLNTG